jgi:hypothetical protein
MPSTQGGAHLGPYSRPATLARIDGRSREARFRKALRAQLVQHVGGKPSVTQAALIELAVDTALQIELMKQARAENGSLTPHDHRVFLAWQNTYRRTLGQLGMRGEAPPAPSLADIFATAPQAAA